MKYHLITKIANEFYKIVIAAYEIEDLEEVQDNIRRLHRAVNDESSDLLINIKRITSILNATKDKMLNKYLSSHVQYYDFKSIIKDIVNNINCLTTDFYNIFWFSGFVDNENPPNVFYIKNDDSFINGKTLSEIEVNEFLSLLNEVTTLLFPILNNIESIISLITTLIINREGSVQECHKFKTLFLNSISAIKKLEAYFNLNVDYTQTIIEFNQHWETLLSNVQEQQQQKEEAILDDLMDPEDRDNPEMIEAFRKGNYY